MSSSCTCMFSDVCYYLGLSLFHVCRLSGGLCVLLIVGGRVVAKGRDGLAGSRVGGFRFIPGCRRRGPVDVDRG